MLTGSELRDLQLLNKKKSKKILLIAEPGTNTDSCRNHLEQNYSVVPAINGEDGLAAFLSEEVNAVVIDSNISKLSGVDLFCKIRQLDDDLPIYYMCNVTSLEDLEKCASMGINGYFKKPFHPTDLVEKIDTALTKSASTDLPALLSIDLPLNINKMHPKIQAVLRVIHENYFRTIKKEDLLDKVNISSEYLSRLFKKESGMTIPQYVGSLRIEKAKELLANSTMNAGKIAAVVGFENENYFYILFKELTGYTPGEFRKLQR